MTVAGNGRAGSGLAAAAVVTYVQAPARRDFADTTSWIALAAEPVVVARARSLANSVLGGWDVDDTTADNAVLIVSELLTNAIVATPGQGRAWLRLSHRAGVVAVEVADSSPESPAPWLASAFDDEHGRGLMIVDALCAEWGCYQLPGTSKVVMAILHTPTAGR